MMEQTQPTSGVYAVGRTWGGQANTLGHSMSRRGRRLVCKSIPRGERAIDIEGKGLTIGRDAACDMVLDWDPTVSRRHARVVLEPAGHVLYDEASTNGTWVNGAAVAAHVLVPGDVIQVGGTRLRYE